MIDWQIQIDGSAPAGWDPHRDGCWFPDFDHQEYLLPFFDVGDSPIDPYDATAFSEADLLRLRQHLNWHRSCFEGKPASWSVTETSVNGSRVIQLEREKVLAVVDQTLKMIDYAIARGGSLIFCGD